MTAILAFLSKIPAKIWGGICTAALGLLLLWALFQKGKSEGKEKAETKAKVEDLTGKVIAHQELTKAIIADEVVINKIEKEVDALPINNVSDRAKRWVRKPAKD